MDKEFIKKELSYVSNELESTFNKARYLYSASNIQGACSDLSFELVAIKAKIDSLLKNFDL